MNDQEAFDIMVKHLRKQGRKSALMDGYTCMYRHPEGLKCAIGVLIPDSEYKPKIEGMTASFIVKKCPSLKDINWKLLNQMQNTHDRFSVEMWESRFIEIAKQFSLKVPNKD